MNDIIYSPNTLISPHTSRPITDVKELNLPMWWCKLCNVKLPLLNIALQHVKGRSHLKVQAAAGQKTVEEASLKHKQQLQSNKTQKVDIVASEPAAKKSKNVLAAPLKSKQQSQANNMPTAKKSNNVQPNPLKSKQQAPARNIPKYVTNVQAPPVKHKQQPRSSIIPNNSHVSSEPVVKSTNQSAEIESNLTCEQCNLTFDSLVQSLRHFKYTIHDIIPLSENNTLNSNDGLQRNGDQPVHPVQHNADQLVHRETIDGPLKSVNKVPRCEDCDLTFQTPSSAQNHFQGKRHKKTMAAKEVIQERDVLSWWQQSGGGRGAKVGTRGTDFRFGLRKKRNLQRMSAVARSNITPLQLDIALQAVLGQLPNNSSSNISYGHQNFQHGMQNNSTSRYEEFTNSNQRKRNYNDGDVNYTTPDYQDYQDYQSDEFGTSQHQSTYHSSMNENNVQFNIDNGLNESSSLAYENY